MINLLLSLVEHPLVLVTGVAIGYLLPGSVTAAVTGVKALIAKIK